MRKLLFPLALIAILGLTGCATPGHPGLVLERVYRARYYAVTLHAGDDLGPSLQRFAREHGLHAACVVSATGRLSRLAVRFVGSEEATTREERFELVSLSGTVTGGELRLAIAAADGNGRTLGGGLAPGCIVEQRVDVILGEIEGLRLP